MKYICFIILNTIVIKAAAGEIIQVPDQCLDREVAPCLVRALDDAFKETPSRIQLYISQDALFKITQFPAAKLPAKAEQFKVELLKGKIVVINNLKVPFYLNTVNVGLDETYFIRKNSLGTELYKSHEAVFFNITKNEDMDLVETKDFPSRGSTTEFLNQFKNIPGAVYKQTLAQYEVRLSDEVQNQKRVLQRKVASDELARKEDAEARQKQNAENKKLKGLFFMRTFKQ